MEKHQNNQSQIEAMGNMAKLARRIRNIQKSENVPSSAIDKKLHELNKLSQSFNPAK